VDDLLTQGWRLHQAGEIAKAEQLYRQVVAADPNNASAWCYFGIACHDQQRYDEAVAAYRRALELQPDFPVALNNLGNTFRLLKRIDESVACFDRALAIKPDYLIGYKNKGTTLCWEGRVAEALKNYEAAVHYGPGDAEIHKHIGILRLLLGDFAGGWPEYEWRWKTGEIKLPELDRPMWDGSSLDGKTILLTPEQGLGDTIHFIRYAKWLKHHYNCRVVFQCPRALRSFLATCPGIDEWVESPADAKQIDTFAPLVHIPGVLTHGPQDFPAEIPYLSAEQSLVKEWAARLSAYGGRRIGLVWRGSPTHHADSMRSIPLADFVPLLRLKGATLFSLQKGPATEELQSLAGRLAIFDLGTALDETTGAFVETAAVLKNLDLLITCDTSVAHVAGALGVPVWVALPNVADWRWLMEGDRTPWYPTMRLFRQRRPGDWYDVLEQIAAALPNEFADLQRKQPDDYTIATSGFNRLARTRQGLVLYNRLDRYIGRSVDRYGEFSAGETDLFEQAIKPGWTVVEAGANIGVHTLALARQVGAKGTVYAFEPQRIVFQTLCANMALNSVTNVHCRQEALGESPGQINVPSLDYRVENNFGGLSLTPPGGGPQRAGELVPMVTLDSLRLNGCDFIKADVEGMELSVLKGAAATIARFRPVLYVENDREQSSPDLITYLHSLGYSLFWHLPRMYSPANFYRNDKNEFGNVVSVNMLGVHSSVATNINGLKKVEGPASDWRSALR
jgi:FkbM family methyltransferase